MPSSSCTTALSRIPPDIAQTDFFEFVDTANKKPESHVEDSKAGQKESAPKRYKLGHENGDFAVPDDPISPVDEAAVANPAPSDRTQVNLDSALTANDAIFVLEQHAEDIKRYLREYPVAGDGHCLFRAVGAQLQEGEQCHRNLREFAAQEVKRSPLKYLPYLVPSTMATLDAWLAQIRASKWGDNLACRALANHLRRPIFIWRSSNLAQPSTAILHDSFATDFQVRPIYLLLDEKRNDEKQAHGKSDAFEKELGTEHYNALLYSNTSPIGLLDALFPPYGVLSASSSATSNKKGSKGAAVINTSSSSATSGKKGSNCAAVVKPRGVGQPMHADKQCFPARSSDKDGLFDNLEISRSDFAGLFDSDSNVEDDETSITVTNLEGKKEVFPFTATTTIDGLLACAAVPQHLKNKQIRILQQGRCLAGEVVLQSVLRCGPMSMIVQVASSSASSHVDKASQQQASQKSAAPNSSEASQPPAKSSVLKKPASKGRGKCAMKKPAAAAPKPSLAEEPEEYKPIHDLGPWKTYNFGPTNMLKCLDDLEAIAEAEGRGEQACEELKARITLYGVSQQTRWNWQRNLERHRQTIERHLIAWELAQEGKTKKEIIEGCKDPDGHGVDVVFINSILKRVTRPASHAWRAEQHRTFGISKQASHSHKLPAPEDAEAAVKGKSMTTSIEDVHAWMHTASWTFCPRCGLRSGNNTVSWGWAKKHKQAVAQTCSGACDLEPEELDTEVPADQKPPASTKLQAYVTPDEEYWKAFRSHVCQKDASWEEFRDILPPSDLPFLSLLDLRVDYETKRGGKASISSKQKKSLVRAIWKREDIEGNLPSEACRRAYVFLYENNSTYQAWVQNHRILLQEHTGSSSQEWRYMRTCELLLQAPGIEVAVRPWLYPQPAMADTDISTRLKAKNRIGEKSTPSLKTSYMRKVFSRCTDYATDYHLLALLHDTALARQVSAVVHKAEDLKMSPDAVAASMNQYEMYWHRETQKLEDMCRQMGCLPNLFFTVAPGEWAFPQHYGLLQGVIDDKDLSSHQAWLTLHLYNCIGALLEKTLLKEGTHREQCGLKDVLNYAFRFEFQQRGTIHVHVVAWVKYREDENLDLLTGRSGHVDPKSPFVDFLEKMFKCGAVDVQCGKSEWCLLRYVAGYVSKASDALHFHKKENRGEGNASDMSKWKQVYRLLCKRSPLEQELAMEFACMPMVKASFTGEHVYAPVPGSMAKNSDRRAYEAYQQRIRLFMETGQLELRKPEGHEEENYFCEIKDGRTVLVDDEEAFQRWHKEELIKYANRDNKDMNFHEFCKGQGPTHMCFLEWYRKYRIADTIYPKKEEDDEPPEDADAPMDPKDQPYEPNECRNYTYIVKRRNVAGPGRNKPCAVGITFAFELLDIFIGQWAAMFLPVMEEDLIHPDLLPPHTMSVPENTVHLAKVLALFCNDPEKLLLEIIPDLKRRGLGDNRIKTFNARTHAHHLLLQSVAKGDEDAEAWSAKNPYKHIERKWSPEQAEVLEAVANGTDIADANDVRVAKRILQVVGGPGTGKTEVVIEATIRAAKKGCKVLLAGPIGLLVSAHRQRMPADLDVTVETIHSSFKIGRDRDQQYIPPGRLRKYDLIVFDEVSQIDGPVWRLLQMAFGELSPCPFVVFVGDFQQLQPVEGVHQLQIDLDHQHNAGTLDRIQLRQHEFARSKDPNMLLFLGHARVRQPSRKTLQDFFGDRLMPKSLEHAVQMAKHLEDQQEGRKFTFLTVTNRGATVINGLRLAHEFPEAAARLAAGEGQASS